jgi:hypothetical protein
LNNIEEGILITTLDDLNKAIELTNGTPCQGAPDLFVNDAEDTNSILMTRYAKILCLECPVLELCASYAMDNRETFGVWGGTSPNDRRKTRLTSSPASSR